MGTEHDLEPDAFCITTTDGGCISTDPRCMHNRPFSYHRDGSRECGSHADNQKLAASDQVIMERRFWHTNLILQVIHDRAFDIHYLNVYRDNDGSNHSLWGIFTDREDCIAKFNEVVL